MKDELRTGGWVQEDLSIHECCRPSVGHADGLQLFKAFKAHLACGSQTWDRENSAASTFTLTPETAVLLIPLNIL